VDERSEPGDRILHNEIAPAGAIGFAWQWHSVAPAAGAQYFICRLPTDVDLLAKSKENLFIMRAVVQRVSQAEVVIDGASVARIGKGILVLAAISRQDTEKDLDWMARKIAGLRIFSDSQAKLNLSLQDIGGQLLVVSQFTLYGDCRKGRRPSYSNAAPPAKAETLYNRFLEIIRQYVPDVKSGQFQAMMEVNLINSGPVTLIIDSPK
jgi:D-tyrosyl-tRNA(Tyr) deacylase